jgi:hypothetical protein
MGLVTDWAYKLPDVVWDIPEAERPEKARFDTDLCKFGERYFIRCFLSVPFAEAPAEFGWGAWAEVKRPVFERYLELYDKDGSTEPVSSGILANNLLPYENSLGMPLNIQFRDPTKRPSLYFHQENASRLAVEQREGIGDARYHEILSILARG